MRGICISVSLIDSMSLAQWDQQQVLAYRAPLCKSDDCPARGVPACLPCKSRRLLRPTDAPASAVAALCCSLKCAGMVITCTRNEISISTYGGRNVSVLQAKRVVRMREVCKSAGAHPSVDGTASCSLCIAEKMPQYVGRHLLWSVCGLPASSLCIQF